MVYGVRHGDTKGHAESNALIKFFMEGSFNINFYLFLAASGRKWSRKWSQVVERIVLDQKE